MNVEPKDCGIGQGEACCAYLTCGPKGFECGRDSPSIKAVIDSRLGAGTMNAKRAPTAIFPDCQLK